MSDYSKQIVYLSKAQYAELVVNGSITVDGKTVTYSENDIYVTPQAEPVTDVQVNGTSVVQDGVANVPIASSSTPGVVKTNGTWGISMHTQTGEIRTDWATTNNIKSGNANIGRVIVPYNQHESVFYGLAKAAGSDEKNSTLPVGQYTESAKEAIQSMLGVSDLIAPAENNLVASKAYKVGDVFTANGKLYKATAAIAADAAIIPAVEGETVAGANCEETSVGEEFVKFTDYADTNVAGVVKIGNTNTGFSKQPNGSITLYPAQLAAIKQGYDVYNAIIPSRQHYATFYGLAKAAGDATQAASDNAVGTYTDDAKAAIRKMLGAIGDVQVNGMSVVTNGVANVPVATDGYYGLVKPTTTYGVTTINGYIGLRAATDTQIKEGTAVYATTLPNRQHTAAFYGLAKAAGDTTQSASSNAVGTYTDNAKASIKSMLGIVDGSTGTVDISGVTPTINAVENTRYVCGEVTSLSFTPPSSGISIVRFTSGSTVTVLTIPNTVKFPEWFDPTALETNTIYEICVTDGTFGAVMSWAL